MSVFSTIFMTTTDVLLVTAILVFVGVMIVAMWRML